MERGSGGGGKLGLVLVDIYAGRLFGLEDKLVYCFKLATDVVRCSIKELVDYADRPAFLKKKVRDLVWVSTRPE